MNRSAGLLKQITDNKQKKYYTELSLDTLENFLHELSIKPKDKEIVVNVGDFMSRYLTALNRNDEFELALLESEALINLIKRYKDISKQTGLDYDLIYILSSCFSLKNTFDKDVIWEIKTSYFNKNEYDDSYECTELRWYEGGWFLETYYSDCCYMYEKTEEKRIKDVFNEIILNG